jgi:uroporphyrinogen decarboxylase
MNKRERLVAAFQRAPVDRPPVALWRHFPGDDLHAPTHAARVAEFQRKFDLDFVKVTPAAGYPAEMFGAQLEDAHNREGTRNYLTRVVNGADDWRKIHALTPLNPVWQRELFTLELIRRDLPRDAPILQTIFSPSYTARSLAGERFLADVREHPDAVLSALDAIAETTARFARDCLEHGADAIFFATQLAARDGLTRDEYRVFGEKFDRVVLDAVKERAEFILLHVHGLDIYFDLFTTYPAQAINWHDRRTAPTLHDAQTQFPGAVVGGIDEWNTLAAGTPEAIRAEIRDAVQQTNGRGLIVSAGCVMATDTPEENVRAVQAALG